MDAWTPAQLRMSTASTIAAVCVTRNWWHSCCCWCCCCYLHDRGHHGRCIKWCRCWPRMEVGECTLLQLDCVVRLECVLWKLWKKVS